MPGNLRDQTHGGRQPTRPTKLMQNDCAILMGGMIVKLHGGSLQR